MTAPRAEGDRPAMGGARLFTAMVTPFNDDLTVDYGRAAELAVKLTAEGNDGLVVAGTTGESPTLTNDEKEQLFKTVADAVGGKAVVLAGVGTNDTRASLDMLKRAEDTGVSGYMLVVPYYNKPGPEGLYAHFSTLASATEKPIMLYNVPPRTAGNMLPETVKRLADHHPNIVALKEASGSMDQMTAAVATGVAVYSGDDSMTLPLLAVGGAGVVSVAGHVAGPAIKQMIDAYFAGEPERAKNIHQTLFPLFNALFVETNPIPVKAALGLAGFPAGPYRSPLVEPRPETVAALQQVMDAAKVL